MQRFYSCSLNPSGCSRSTSKHSCLLCNSNVDDEFKLGVFFATKYRREWIAAHHHCLLFAAGLTQAGRDRDGFAGFLFPDIVKESKRCRRLRCSYCKKACAASGCNERSCRQVYHYLCGLSGGCLFQFFGSFETFCGKHRPRPLLGNGQGPLISKICPICMEEINMSIVSHNVILSPCCSKAYFHRHCIQKQAYAAGYHHFRCALCNNSDKFVKEMLRHGINVPTQDAIWEVGGLFDDLYEQYARCDAEDCRSLKGRNHKEERGPWRIICCNACGQAGRHYYCLEDKHGDQQWECEACSGVKDIQSDLATAVSKWPSPEPNQRQSSIEKLSSPESKQASGVEHQRPAVELLSLESSRTHALLLSEPKQASIVELFRSNSHQKSEVELFTPESHQAISLPGRRKVYDEDSNHHLSLSYSESVGRRYSSPQDETSFQDLDGEIGQEPSCQLMVSSTMKHLQDCNLSSFKTTNETATTDLNLDDSVVFVRAISIASAEHPRKVRSCPQLEILRDLDSEQSDSDLEPTVYSFTFAQ